jgi:multiple sugar transport system substrate-binding protein
MVHPRTSVIARRVRMAAAAAVVALVATACVGGGGRSSDSDTQAGRTVQPVTPQEPTSPVTITFQSWVGEAEQMKKLAADFKKLHPNVTVKFMNVPADSATQKLTTQAAGGNPPDTVFIDSGAVQDFAQRKAFVNLDGYIAGSQAVKLDDYVAGFKQTATYQNSMFALPYDGETTGLFYRTDLFEAAGITSPPTTWEELQAAAQKLTDPAKKQYGYILFAPEAQYYWLPFLWQAGGNLLSQDGKTIAFNSPQGVQAADFYVGLRKYAPRTIWPPTPGTAGSPSPRARWPCTRPGPGSAARWPSRTPRSRASGAWPRCRPAPPAAPPPSPATAWPSPARARTRTRPGCGSSSCPGRTT